MHRNRTLAVAGSLALAAGAVLVPAVAAQAGVSQGTAFYVDGVAYRTVATPNDLSGTGAPDHSFDTIYDLGGAQANVAEAAPGDTDYNGGRWQVTAVLYEDFDDVLEAGDLNDDGILGSAEEVEAAIDAGAAMDGGVVASFTCPVIPFPGGR
ncbi:hypothetical protein [Isoptericola sediminis]|uniref:EF-hand domain-containing protein n=1 Tax=Isoptericola sediminis TaxID=2733572 RepID=A0A849K3B5_9MICO|nr:hypothetical protein [Isoptericola sediminis]NNU27281.1 hypothetical protein [Isoptericola sediminis]